MEKTRHALKWQAYGRQGQEALRLAVQGTLPATWIAKGEGCAIMGGNVPFCPRNVHFLRAKKREAKREGLRRSEAGGMLKKRLRRHAKRAALYGARAPSGGAMVQAYGQEAGQRSRKLREAGGADAEKGRKNVKK